MFSFLNRSSLDPIIEVIKKIMSRREEIDSRENAIDHRHDLPVYHRVQNLLKILNSHLNQFDNEKKMSFRPLTTLFLQFDKTLTPLIGKLLLKIAQNKEDLENGLKILQENLSENYFERILTQLSSSLNNADSCPFIQILNLDEKLHLALWFIKQKNRELLVLDLILKHVFNQSGVNRELSQNLLRQLRQSENLLVKEQTMIYTVPWKDNQTILNDDDNDRMSLERSFDSDMS